jgi:hypothetical protein
MIASPSVLFFLGLLLALAIRFAMTSTVCRTGEIQWKTEKNQRSGIMGGVEMNWGLFVGFSKRKAEHEVIRE